VPLSAKELESAMYRLLEFSHPNLVLSLRAKHEADFSCGKWPPGEFLARLQENLEWLSAYERLRCWLHSMAKFISLFCLEGD